MKKTALLIILFSLLVIAALVYGISRGNIFQQPTITPSGTSSQNTVTYFCTNGKNITATFASSTVSLALSDGRSFMLPQVMSGSGIRYEEQQGTSSDITFSNEGDNAFLTENNQTTYDNCLAGTTASYGTSTIFTDEGKTFSFVYPSNFTVVGGGVGYTQSWAQQATTSGLLLAVLNVPQSFEPKTNFADAAFSVGTSPDPQAVSYCLTPSQGNGSKPTQVTINGVLYTTFTISDAGAGNFYTTTTYRVVRNSQCYAIEYTIHSTNIGNYPPSLGISQFDQQKIQNVLDGIVQSFKFL